MGPELVPYLLYEPEDNGILWIKFNRPERMNALVGTAQANGTVAKVGEYLRAAADDPNVWGVVLTGVGRGFCAGADLRGAQPGEDAGDNFPGARGLRDGPDANRQSFSHGLTKPHCAIRAGCENTRLPRRRCLRRRWRQFRVFLAARGSQGGSGVAYSPL